MSCFKACSETCRRSVKRRAGGSRRSSRSKDGTAEHAGVGTFRVGRKLDRLDDAAVQCSERPPWRRITPISLSACRVSIRTQWLWHVVASSCIARGLENQQAWLISACCRVSIKAPFGLGRLPPAQPGASTAHLFRLS